MRDLAEGAARLDRKATPPPTQSVARKCVPKSEFVERGRGECRDEDEDEEEYGDEDEAAQGGRRSGVHMAVENCAERLDVRAGCGYPSHPVRPCQRMPSDHHCIV